MIQLTKQRKESYSTIGSQGFIPKIENSAVCQKIKKKTTKSNTYLHPLPQANHVFERVNYDLFQPIKNDFNHGR